VIHKVWLSKYIGLGKTAKQHQLSLESKSTSSIPPPKIRRKAEIAKGCELKIPYVLSGASWRIFPRRSFAMP
jgi:hypothetical protein